MSKHAGGVSVTVHNIAISGLLHFGMDLPILTAFFHLFWKRPKKSGQEQHYNHVERKKDP
jgi:hypothetical protein